MAQESALTIGGQDRFEDEAERNEARIVADVQSGRWASLEASADRTLGARMQRRPIGSWLVQASLAGVLPPKADGSVSTESGGGGGSISIGTLTVRWPSPTAATPAGELVRSPQSGTPTRGSTPPGFADSVAHHHGQELPADVRARMENAFGADFRDVRIHTDAAAGALAQRINARAFTTGNDVFFNQGQFQPRTPSGLGLLGHELTHVVQQRGRTGGAGLRTSEKIQRSPLGRGGLLEAAGRDHVLRLSSAGGSAPAAPPPPSAPGAPPPPPRRPVARAASAPGAPGAPATSTGGRVVIAQLVLQVGAHAPAMVVAGEKKPAGAAETIRGHQAGHTGEAPAGLDQLLSRSVGQPLQSDLARELGSAFGVDFSNVRVHTDAPAGMACAAVKAHAFAHGRDIFFAPGQYSPNTARGAALIGHELTHVAQSAGAGELRRKPVAKDATDEDVQLAKEEREYLERLFRKAYLEKWFLRKNQRGFAGNATEWTNVLRGDDKQVYAGCRNFAADTFELFAFHGDPRYHKIEHIRGFRQGNVGPVLYTTGAPHQVARVTNLITGEVSVFDMWALAGGWATGMGDRSTKVDEKDVDWNKGIYPYSRFGYTLGVSVEQQYGPNITGSHLRRFRAGGKEHKKPYAEQRPTNLFKKGLKVAGRDPLEHQAEENERAILAAYSGGRGRSRPRLMALRATRAGSRSIQRKEESEHFVMRMADWAERKLTPIRDAIDDVGVKGIQMGGVTGNVVAAYAAVWSGLMQPRKLVAFVEGLGTGVYEGVKGTVNMVVHPIETVQGMYRLVVNFDETKGALKAKVAELVEASHSDPEKFARMMGELTGQIELALIGPKVIAGPKDVVGFLRTAKNIVPVKGRTLWHYAPAKYAEGIWKSKTIGHAGAAEAFATPLDPMLAGSRSMLGRLANAGFTGGRLNIAPGFLREAGRLFKETLSGRLSTKAAWAEAKAGKVFNIKDPMVHGFSFTGGEFRHIWFTNVESALARALKGTMFPQYAAKGPQLVKDMQRVLLTNKSLMNEFLDGAGMLGAGGNIAIGNTELDIKEMIEAGCEWVFEKLLSPAEQGEVLKKELPGRSLLEDADEAVLRRMGGRLARTVDALDKPGLPLEWSLRTKLEREVGADLSAVRIHTGLDAERLATALGAEAFALGNRVVMGEGAWRPDSAAGLGVLAHEAMHVVQSEQGRLAGPASASRTRQLEAEAHAVERRVAAAAPRAAAAPPPPAPPPMVLREAPPAAVDDVPAPAAPAPAPRALRKAKRSHHDPIQRVMDSWSVAHQFTREEFLAVCTDRVLELMREEMELSNERGGTLAWAPDTPLV